MASCSRQRCSRRAQIAGLCVSHAEQMADARFSRFVRSRDRRCTAQDVLEGTRCAGPLQACHIVGRRRAVTRYDEANVHTCCAAHHRTIDQAGSEHAKYRWATSLLGEDGYAALMARAQVSGKRLIEVEKAYSRYLGWTTSPERSASE